MLKQVRHDGLRVWRWLTLLLMLVAAIPAAAQTFPKFTGLVVDNANVLSPQTEADLTAKLQALQNDTKRQVVVATIADMQGYPLEDYGYRLGRAWGVGLKDVDNGIILFIAPNNPQGQRGPRIEVGRGLEPIMTDALSSVIINQSMMPKLKAGDIDGAVTAGTDQIIAQLRASPEEAQARLDAAVKEFNRTHERRSSGGVPIEFVFVILVILFVFVLPLIGRMTGGKRYRRSGVGDAVSSIGEVILWSAINGALNGGRDHDDDGGWGGGGGGSSGGWGGGGFSGGGGGSFGGGGASGSW